MLVPSRKWHTQTVWCAGAPSCCKTQFWFLYRHSTGTVDVIRSSPSEASSYSDTLLHRFLDCELRMNNCMTTPEELKKCTSTHLDHHGVMMGFGWSMPHSHPGCRSLFCARIGQESRLVTSHKCIDKASVTEICTNLDNSTLLAF